MITPKLTKYTVTQSPAGLRRSRSRSIVTTNLNRRRSLHWGPSHLTRTLTAVQQEEGKGNILILFLSIKISLFVNRQENSCWKRKARLLLVRLLRDHFKVWTLNYNHAEPVLFGGKIFFLSGKYWLALREADAKAGKWMTWQFQILVSKSLWSVISSKRRSLDVLLG